VTTEPAGTVVRLRTPSARPRAACREGTLGFPHTLDDSKQLANRCFRRRVALAIVDARDSLQREPCPRATSARVSRPRAVAPEVCGEGPLEYSIASTT